MLCLFSIVAAPELQSVRRNVCGPVKASNHVRKRVASSSGRLGTGFAIQIVQVGPSSCSNKEDSPGLVYRTTRQSFHHCERGRPSPDGRSRRRGRWLPARRVRSSLPSTFGAETTLQGSEMECRASRADQLDISVPAAKVCGQGQRSRTLPRSASPPSTRGRPSGRFPRIRAAAGEGRPEPGRGRSSRREC